MKTSIFSGLLFCLAFAGCETVKITNRIIDETGDPLKDVNTWVSWEVLKTLDPWAGTKSVHKSGQTNLKGGCTFSGFTGPKIWVGAVTENYYRSAMYYTFSEADGQADPPWHPTVTLRLRPRGNPIPMYAKQFLQLVCPSEEVGYDLIKGDFVAPHGEGEVTDCHFKFIFQDDGTPREPGYTRSETFSVTFPGDFNGVVPINENDMIRESQFIWPREAYSGAYEVKTISNEYHVVVSKNPKRSSLRVYNETNTQTPEGKYFFFRIRSEKNPDGSFKSALYGKFIFPRIEIFTDRSFNEILYRLKMFSYYVNPTRNDRNMEFDTKENLMYSHRKIWYETDKWVIDPRAYKRGEQGVSAP